MERSRLERILTAADIMYAYTRLTKDLARDASEDAPFVAGQIVGAERLMRIMLEMLVENEVSDDG
jgi:hypothetical protein